MNKACSVVHSKAGFSLGHGVCQRLFPGPEGRRLQQDTWGPVGQFPTLWSPWKGLSQALEPLFTDYECKAHTPHPTRQEESRWPLINCVLSHSRGLSSDDLPTNPAQTLDAQSWCSFFQNLQWLPTACMLLIQSWKYWNTENTEKTMKLSPCKHN